MLGLIAKAYRFLSGTHSSVEDLKLHLQGLASSELGELKDEEPPPGLPPYARHFVNDAESIFYIRTRRPDRVLVETVDIISETRHGSGIVVTFENRQMFKWTHNGVTLHINSRNPQVVQHSKQILAHVRKAAGF